MASSQIIILAIIATSLATFISRFMGALTSEKVSVKSKIFQWFNCVAYSTLAALLGRMIIFPSYMWHSAIIKKGWYKDKPRVSLSGFVPPFNLGVE